VIPLSEIGSVQAVTYRPLREFGGWGIRWGWKGSRAYSIAGNRGVELELREGKLIVVGSETPEALATAIGSARTSA
jgi:hypothetical protein